MQAITSPHNPRLKSALQLRTSRGRRKQNRFIIDGLREIRRALECGLSMVELFVCQRLMKQDELDELTRLAATRQTVLLDVPMDLFARLAYGDRRDGVVAVAYRPELSLEKLLLSPQPLVAILQSPEKPGNIGAVVRSADGAGVEALIVADPHCDPLHPNSIRASMGTVFSIGLACATLEQTVQWVQRRGLTLLALGPRGDRCYSQVDYRQPLAIVLGSEASGLDAQWERSGATTVSIPMRGVADSLNLSVSAGVVFFEAARQRSAAGPD